MHKMNTKKIAYFLAFLLLFGAAFSASAATDTRYLINSNSAVWKKYFGVRHSFESGFSADLSDFQLRMAKIFGLKVEPVVKFYILSASQLIAQTTVKQDDAVVRPTPTEKIPWGIKAMHNNDETLAETSGGEGVKVAVLDTGVFKDHLDLKNRIKECKDFSTSANPVVDDSCDDNNGHGTHVVGIIAADGGEDNLGIMGMAPQAEIFAYSVCSSDGTCWGDDIAAAIRVAVDNGANIINLSLGSDTESVLVRDAVGYAAEKGVLVVASAGNDGPYAGSIDYPAFYTETVSVGAVDVDLATPDWSSRGNNLETDPEVFEAGDIEFAAPGVGIESTWKDGNYAILSGTSMAAPHIAGLAAKVWDSEEENPVQRVRELLRELVFDLLPAGEDDGSGLGMPVF